MRLRYIGFILVTLLFYRCDTKNCSNETQLENALNESKIRNVIRARGNLIFNGAVGYGYIYTFKVEKVLEGTMQQETINLVVLTGDKREKYINNHTSPSSVEITFRRKDENVEYSTMPLTGFVDNNMTSWEVEDLIDCSKAEGK